MNLDLNAFRIYLQHQGYAETTLKATLVDAQTIVNHLEASKPVARRMKLTIARLHSWGKVPDIVLRANANLADPATKKKPPRDARSIPDEEWSRLITAIEKSPEPAARVAEVMAATGRRVGDMLRIERDTLLTGVPRGEMNILIKGDRYVHVDCRGAPEAWEHLRSAIEMTHCVNVASFVSPGHPESGGASAAYMAVRRFIQKTAAEVGCNGPVWTHRFRRTVGVQVYRLTKDILAVRDMLDHRSIVTTERYLSESRDEQKVELQKKIREQFKK